MGGKVSSANAGSLADQLKANSHSLADSEMAQSGHDAALKQLLMGKQADQTNEMAKLQQQHDYAAGDVANYAKQSQDYIDQNAKLGRKVSANIGPHGAMISQEDKFDPALRNMKKQLDGAQITGFDVADPSRVIPTAKDAEEIKNDAAAVRSANSIIPDVQKSVNDSSWRDRFGMSKPFGISIGTEKGRDLEQKKAAVLDFARHLQGIKVLRPGELPLMEKRIGDITGLASMFRKPEDINSQLDNILIDLQDKAKTDATARGYKPQSGYLDAPENPPQQLSLKRSGGGGALPPADAIDAEIQRRAGASK